MIAEDLQKQITELGELYWEGKENSFIRHVTYLRRGNALFNEFKNYIMFAFASYWTVKTSDIWLAWALSDSWLITGFLILIPIGLVGFLLVGRYDLHKVAKTTDYVQTMSGSIFKYKPMELNIEQVNEIKGLRADINKLLNEKHNKTN